MLSARWKQRGCKGKCRHTHTDTPLDGGGCEYKEPQTNFKNVHKSLTHHTHTQLSKSTNWELQPWPRDSLKLTPVTQSNPNHPPSGRQVTPRINPSGPRSPSPPAGAREGAGKVWGVVPGSREGHFLIPRSLSGVQRGRMTSGPSSGPSSPGPIMKLRALCTSPRSPVSAQAPPQTNKGRSARPWSSLARHGPGVPGTRGPPSLQPPPPGRTPPAAAAAPVPRAPPHALPARRMEPRRARRVPALLLVLGESAAPCPAQRARPGRRGGHLSLSSRLQRPPLPSPSLLGRRVRSFPPAADGMGWARGAGSGVQYAFR